MFASALVHLQVGRQVGRRRSQWCRGGALPLLRACPLENHSRTEGRAPSLVTAR